MRSGPLQEWQWNRDLYDEYSDIILRKDCEKLEIFLTKMDVNVVFNNCNYTPLLKLSDAFDWNDSLTTMFKYI